MFGRRKDDEDPFAALKDGATYQSTSTALPDLGLGDDAPVMAGPGRSPAAASSASASPATYRAGSAPAPAGPPRGRAGTPVRVRSGVGPGFRLGALWRLVVFAVVSVIIGSAVLGVSHSVHSIKVPTFTFNTGVVTTPTPGGTTSTPSGRPPRPVDYLTSAGLRAGLAHVARLARGAQLTLLRVDARTLSVYATRRSGRTSQIYLSSSVTFVSPAPAPGERPLPARAIQPRVLGALITQLRRRFGVPRSRIDYVVVSSPSGQPPEWILFVKNASHQGYVAPLNGGALTRI